MTAGVMCSFLNHSAEEVLAWSMDHVKLDGQDGCNQSLPSLLDRYLDTIASYAGVVFRARYTEEALSAAVARGVRQYVQIGAGFDSFSLRRPPFSRGITVYEVDHPATQDLKLRRLSECGVAMPVGTTFIASDLVQEDVGTALQRSNFNFNEPAFFSWLGVTIYLTRDANIASLRAIADCAKPESSLVFTYTDEEGLEPAAQSEEFRRMTRSAREMGEPFVSGFDPGNMVELLASVGLTLDEDLTGVQLADRYGRSSSAPLVPSRFSRVALAHVRGEPERDA